MTLLANIRVRDMSVKTRLTLAVALFFTLAFALLTVFSISVFERTLEKVIDVRQSSLIQNTADEIDQKFELRRSTLIRLAVDLGSVPRDNDNLQSFLEQQHSLDGLFDNFAIFDLKGDLIANMDRPETRGKLNISTRDYFQKSIAEGKVVISSPLKSGVSGRPIVVICVPIFDPRGQMILTLLGTIELTEDSFLANFANEKIGATGYFYIVTAKGFFVTHPDQSRILKNTSDLLGKSKSLDMALSGFEGTTMSTTRQGQEAIFSFKRLKSVDWIVTAVYPSEEAFSPIIEVKRSAIFVSITLLVILLPLAWWFMYRQLAPLQKLRNKVITADTEFDINLLPKSYPKDEIGELAKSFDDAMARRLAAESALVTSENKLRLIADNMSAFIGYIDYNEKYTFVNKQVEKLFGLSAKQAIGKTIKEVTAPAFYHQIKPFINQVLNGEWTRYEHQAQRNGNVEWDRVTYVPDINADGMVDGFFVLVEDITEFKRIQTELTASEKRTRTITDNVPALIGYIDADERYQFCNRFYNMIPGLNSEMMIGQTVKDVFGEAPYLELKENIRQALKGKAVSFERFTTERGLARYLQYEYVPDVNLDGSTVGFYTMVIDVTGRKEAELKQQSSEGLLRAIADNIPAFVGFIDKEDRFQFVNRPYEAWFNLPLAEIRGRSVLSLLSEPIQQLHTEHFQIALAGEKTEFELQISISGIFNHYRATYAPQRDEAGNVIGVNSLINDITDAKAIETQLLALARFDTLTGLPNRNQLNERLAEATARSTRNQRSIAVMFLDLDRFKSINDTLGHHAGDLVLKEFAFRLKGCIRQTDMVGRLGGDEFVIVLEGLNSQEESEIVGSKIIQAMTTPFNIDGNSRIITTSIGIAISNTKNSSGEDLLNKADEALYLAKKAGRNIFRSLEL
ncbi:diguanylate cyclase (GGDEF)-like protein/PAS domain S-box-containing protein [Undibacterium sp. GrIS 1.8]|uniref:sensor domain-containing diguanylate cyclase n=1 Tax=Undibacterium sp. GrIS 1.8 TaxID=3143934 RepID=UPI0033975201